MIRRRINDPEYPYAEAKSFLELLSSAFEVTLEDGEIVFTDGCDGVFSVYLKPEDIGPLCEELMKLVEGAK